MNFPLSWSIKQHCKPFWLQLCNQICPDSKCYVFRWELFFAIALLFLLSVCYSCLSMFEPKNLWIYLPRTTWSPFPVCAHVGRPEVGNDAPNAQQQKRRRCYFLIRDLNWQIFKDPFNYNVCFLFSLPCFVSALKSLNLRIFFK